MSHAVNESVKLTPVSAMFRQACMMRWFGYPTHWDQIDTPRRCSTATIAGVAVTVAVGSPGVVVGAAKDVVAVIVEVTPWCHH